MGPHTAFNSPAISALSTISSPSVITRRCRIHMSPQHQSGSQCHNNPPDCTLDDMMTTTCTRPHQKVCSQCLPLIARSQDLHRQLQAHSELLVQFQATGCSAVVQCEAGHERERWRERRLCNTRTSAGHTTLTVQPNPPCLTRPQKPTHNAAQGEKLHKPLPDNPWAQLTCKQQSTRRSNAVCVPCHCLTSPVTLARTLGGADSRPKGTQ